MAEFKFNEKAHVYTLDGKRLYGVTNVLGVIAKPALIQWSANMAVDYMNEALLSAPGGKLWEYMSENWANICKEARTAHRKKKDKAADVGTDVHALCEDIINIAIKGNDGFVGDGYEAENPMVQKFIQWAIDNKVQFHASEKRMYSEKMWVAGTADFTATINGKRIMGDIKTSSGIYGREYFLQCAGYILMSEEHGEEYDGSVIVRLGKDGSFETKESWDLETDKQGFLHALGLFKALNQ